MRLVLDVKEADATQIESVRLQVVWSIDAGDLINNSEATFARTFLFIHSNCNKT